MSTEQTIPRYERNGEVDQFLVGIVGHGDEEHTHTATVNLFSRPDDQVGVVRLCVIDRDDADDVNDYAEIFLEGPEAAMLALILQDVARQWQERNLSSWTQPAPGAADASSA